MQTTKCLNYFQGCVLHSFLPLCGHLKTVSPYASLRDYIAPLATSSVFFYLFFFKPELWGGDSIQKCVRIQLFLAENTAHYFSSWVFKEMHLFTFTLKRGKFVALIYRLSCSRNIFRSNHFRAGSRKLWRNL